MLNGLRRMIRWLSALARLSPDELKQAGVHLGNTHD
jgi:hypothetical protein